MPKIYARRKSKGSFDILAKFFGAIHMKIGPFLGELESKMCKKSPPTGRNCENRAISLEIRVK